MDTAKPVLSLWPCTRARTTPVTPAVTPPTTYHTPQTLPYYTTPHNTLLTQYKDRH